MIPYKNSLPVRAILVVCLLFLSLLAGILVSLHDYKVRAAPTYHNTDITSIEYWNGTENPHIITGDIDINNGGILYIGAGTIVKFDGNNEIRVNSGCALYANGTDNERITINSNSSTGDKSIWRQIRYKTGSSGSLKNCNIIKGGKNSPAIEIATSNVIIENCSIQFCRKAIYISNGNPIIQNNTIHNCTTAIEVDGGSPYIFNNNIYNITTTGINILVGSADIRMNKISSLDTGIALFKTGSVDRFDQNTVSDCAVGILVEKNIKIENSTIKNSTQFDFQFNPPPSAKVFALNSSFECNSVIPSTCKLIKQWFVHVFINDTQGNPMEDVDVTLTPNGQTANVYKTDGNGWKRWIVCTEFENTSSSITYWTPYTIKVHKNGYNSTTIYPNITESKSFHFTLKDISKPTSALDKIPHYWFNNLPIELNYTSSDNLYLKKVELYYSHSIDNQTFSNALMINSTDILGELSSAEGAFTFKFNDGEGHYYLYTLATDIMDNTESYSSAEIVKLGYDITPPEFENIEVTNVTEDSKGICYVEVTIKDIYSGLAGMPRISFKYDSTNASWFMSNKKMKELKQTVTSPNRGSEATYYYDIPMPGKGWDHYKDKSLKWEISCTDQARNTNIKSNLEKIDSVNHIPEIKFISPKPDSWNSGIIKIQTSPNDDLDIGDPSSEWGIDYAYAQYSLDSIVDVENGTWLECTSSPTTSDPFDIYWDSMNVGTNDNVWLRLRCVDNGGLASNWDLLKIKIDNEPAESHIESFADIWYNTDLQINLLASDGEGTGVEDIYYKLNNGTSNSTQFGMPLITTENANNTIEYWSVDNQGNSELHKFKYGIKLDKTTPEIINVSVTNVTIYSDTTIDIVLLADVRDSLSGLDGMPRLRVKYPGENFNDWIDMELDSGSRYKTILDLSNINLHNLSGSKLIFEVRATDHADNTEYRIFSELIDNQTTELPEIVHTPVTEWFVNKQIIINAMTKYVRPIDKMVVHYKSVLGGSFESIEMDFVREDPDTEKSNWFIYLYTVEIPAQTYPGEVHYYISIHDNLTTTTVTSPEILPENNSFIINIIELKKETDYEVPEWWLEHYFGDIDEYISDGDPDEDGLTNMEEFENNTNPTKNDTDNDCLPDKWEIDNQMDPNDPNGKNGAYGDCDGDGISNLEEFEQESKPAVIDDEPKSTPKQESEDLKSGNDTDIYIGIIIVMVLIIILLLISLFRRKKTENENNGERSGKKSNPGEDVDEENTDETEEEDEELEDSENDEEQDYVEDLTSSKRVGSSLSRRIRVVTDKPGISDGIEEYEEDYDYETIPFETEGAESEQEDEFAEDLEEYELPGHEIEEDMEDYELPTTDTEDEMDDVELPTDETDEELEEGEIKLGNHEEELLLKVKKLKEKIKKRDI